MNEKSIIINNVVSYKVPKKDIYLLLFTTVFIFLVIVSSAVFAQEVDNWECRVEGSNDGCKKTIKAPSGKKIVGVTAACNLEYGAVSNTELASVPANTIKVVKKSDSRWYRPDGYCYVRNTKISKGKKTIDGINGINQIRVGCFEHDKNGGDCHIRGVVILEDGETTPDPDPDPDPDPNTLTKCGSGNCPSGYHSKKYQFSLSCGDSSLLTPNQTVCEKNTGSSFTQCSAGNCPSGYHESSRDFSPDCGSTLTDNRTTCVRNNTLRQQRGHQQNSAIENR